ncbi:MAG TPA: alpha/beta hydrolase [Bacteroidia bacterium]|jgi:hypothetical protein|nr:alpha/beta hydrolase [Bacteroidia bacterium]
MDVKHYVITTRPVQLVQVPDVPDQYWYESDENTASESAVAYFRCGQYTDNNGTAGAPFFYDPQGEDADYPATPAPIGASQQQPKGGSLEMLTNLFTELDGEGKELLIFMFGYNNGLEKEYSHIMNIHNNYINSDTNIGRLLMITWPSQCFGEYNQKLGIVGTLGKLIDKITGKEIPSKTPEQINCDAGITGDALSVFLLKLNTFVANRYATGTRPKIHFIVQSMANHILDQCFLNLCSLHLNNQVDNLMDNLMLTSPDIRNDVFQQGPGYRQSTAMAKKAFVVFSRQDPILKLADAVHPIPGAARLGLTGPSTGTVLPDNTTTLEVVQTDFRPLPVDFNHRYFEYNPEVIQEYAAVFKGGVVKPLVNA